MSLGGATSPRRCLAQAVTSCLLVTAASPLAIAATQAPVALRAVTVEERAGAFIVTLSADGPIASRLQRLPGSTGSPARLYLDLAGTEPKVVAHTAVNRGPVLRIRVGLNSAEPLVTRVVIDLSTDIPSRLETGVTNHQLRVVIGPSDEAEDTVSLPAAIAAPAAADAPWCRDFAARVDALLQSQARVTTLSAITAEAALVNLENEAESRSAPPQLERIHLMLLQAVRLARIAASGTQRPEQAAAARHGARLLVETARVRLAELP